MALDVNEGEAPVVQGVEEVADGDRDVAARSMARRATKRCPSLAGNHRWSSAEARACSVCVRIDDLMHGSAEKLVREMRRSIGRLKEGRRGAGHALTSRNQRRTASTSADSGDQLRSLAASIGERWKRERKGARGYL
jgi:hypothetical protein